MILTTMYESALCVSAGSYGAFALLGSRHTARAAYRRSLLCILASQGLCACWCCSVVQRLLPV